nr:hypothetical protein CFP56_12873 [Quercus suber]
MPAMEIDLVKARGRTAEHCANHAVGRRGCRPMPHPGRKAGIKRCRREARLGCVTSRVTSTPERKHTRGRPLKSVAKRRDESGGWSVVSGSSRRSPRHSLIGPRVPLCLPSTVGSISPKRHLMCVVGREESENTETLVEAGSLNPRGFAACLAYLARPALMSRDQEGLSGRVVRHMAHRGLEVAGSDVMQLAGPDKPRTCQYRRAGLGAGDVHDRTLDQILITEARLAKPRAPAKQRWHRQQPALARDCAADDSGLAVLSWDAVALRYAVSSDVALAEFLLSSIIASGFDTKEPSHPFHQKSGIRLLEPGEGRTGSHYCAVCCTLHCPVDPLSASAAELFCGGSHCVLAGVDSCRLQDTLVCCRG